MLFIDLPEHISPIEVLIAEQWGDQPLKPGDAAYMCPGHVRCSEGANVARTVMPQTWPKVSDR
eukprot:5934211-Karenia_brevis.AAC.1